jgi:hypothetical protein
MKINIKITTPLLIIIALGIIYFFSQDNTMKGRHTQDKQMQDRRMHMQGQQLQGQQLQGQQMQVTITDSEVLDRQPTVEEQPELLPANEIYATAQKGWSTCCSSNDNSKGMAAADKELYADDAPMFEMIRPVNLVAPDLNSTARRVNFY